MLLNYFLSILKSSCLLHGFSSPLPLNFNQYVSATLGFLTFGFYWCDVPCMLQSFSPLAGHTMLTIFPLFVNIM